MPPEYPRIWRDALIAPFLLSISLLMAQETGKQTQPVDRQHPAVTEVPSLQVPEEYRNALPVAPDPPSVRYEQLRQHLPPRIVLPSLDVTPFIEEDKNARKNGELKARGGVMRAVKITPDKDGEWTEPAPGVRIWRIEVQSPGAKGLKLRLEDVKLANKSAIYIYVPGHSPEIYVNASDTAGRLFSGLLRSDTVRLELVQTLNPDDPYQNDQFVITGVGHAYRGQGEVAGITPPGTCELDAACYSDWLQSGNSVGLINYAQGNYIYYCSGAMINNNTGDYSPLFLTAAHCGIDTNVAPSVSVEWLYASTSCGVPPVFQSGSTGATFLATSAESDSTLLKLMPLNIPGAVTWSGWSIDPQSGAITGIHHPEASYRRISFGNLIADDPTNPDFHRTIFTQGITEPGSSGSPLFNANHQIIGQLYGGKSTCANPGGVDIYGKLAVSYPHFVDAQGNNYLVSGLGDDRFGDISSRDKAPLILAGQQQSNLVLRYGHDDWFNLGTLQRGLTLGAGFPFGNAATIGIELYRNQEVTPISRNVTGSLSAQLPSTDNYYLRFFLSGTVIRQEYAMSYSTIEPASPYVSALDVSQPRNLSDYKYNGRIGASGAPGIYWFEYAQGTDLTNMQVSPAQPFDGTFNGAVSFMPPQPFQEDTNYTFRLAANDGFQTVKSNSITFHTISGILVVNPTNIVFPDTAVGSESAQTVMITNADLTHNLNFTSPLTTSDYPIYLNSDCPTVLSPGASCHLTVIFHPISAGPLWPYYAAGFTTSAGNASISLTGKGLQAVPSLEDFPAIWPVLIGSRSTITLRLVNVGNIGLDTTNIKISGPFSETNDCPALLPPQQGCHMYLTAAPKTLTDGLGTLVMGRNMYPLEFGVDPFDIQMSDPRAARPHRGGAGPAAVISAGQTAAFQVTLAPSSPSHAIATMACSDVPTYLSCEVRPSAVDLSGKAKEVEVVVTVEKSMRRLQMTSGRPLRLDNGTARESTERSQTVDLQIGVIAKVGNAYRKVLIPIKVRQ